MEIEIPESQSFNKIIILDSQILSYLTLYNSSERP